MPQKPDEVALDVPAQRIRRNKHDTIWMLSLYGTAIGAGTLFLPIEAGMNGLLPLIVMLLLAFPMTYYSHQSLSRFVLSGASAHADITDVVEQHFGRLAGRLLTVLYFFSIYPILLMYSVAITNTTQSWMINQLDMTPPPRPLLAFGLIAVLTAIIRFGEKTIIRSMSVLVYPFIGILILISLYLIPHWNIAIFQRNPDPQSLWKTLWLIIPIMVFSFNHSPIISSFSVSQKKRYSAEADERSGRILRYSHTMMVGTVMFFVFSCVFSLSPYDLALAKEQNISILSYLANHFHTPFIAFVAPLVALIAISKSFLGHYLGASEGLQGIINKLTHRTPSITGDKQLQYFIDLFIVLSCWICATINPNILNMIATLCGPLIAIILFLMPLYAIHRVSALLQYRNKVRDGFLSAIGLVALSAIFYNLWMTFQ